MTLHTSTLHLGELLHSQKTRLKPLGNNAVAVSCTGFLLIVLPLSCTHSHCVQPCETEQVTHTMLSHPLFLTASKRGKGRTKAHVPENPILNAIWLKCCILSFPLQIASLMSSPIIAACQQLLWSSLPLFPHFLWISSVRKWNIECSGVCCIEESPRELLKLLQQRDHREDETGSSACLHIYSSNLLLNATPRIMPASIWLGTTGFTGWDWLWMSSYKNLL